MADESYTWLDRLDAVVRRRLEVRLTHSRLYHELFHVHTVPDGEEPLKQVRALLAEILEALECDRAQGYLFARSSSPDAVSELALNGLHPTPLGAGQPPPAA